MSRLGSDYQKEVAPTNTYQILKGDDVIIPIIATGKTFTLPQISSLGVDDREKIIGNDSTSAGNATYAAFSGDTLVGLTVMLPGQLANIRAIDGLRWAVVSAVVDSGTGTTATSVADSKGESASTRAVSNSTVISTNLSTTGSQNTSQSTLLSVATSAAISG